MAGKMKAIQETADGGIRWSGAASHVKADIFTRAKMALTDAGKAADYLSNYCEISIVGSNIEFRPLESFMSGVERDKNGTKKPVDMKPAQSAALQTVRREVETLGFDAETYNFANGDPSYVNVNLLNQQNLDAFKQVGQMLEFNRFTMQFRHLDKASLDFLVKRYTEQLKSKQKNGRQMGRIRPKENVEGI